MDFVARQVKVDPAELTGYDFTGRSIKEHRRQVREYLGIEPPGRMDRIIGHANAAADKQFCASTVSRLGPAVIAAWTP